MESPFHRGELELQERTGVRDRLAVAGGRSIRDYMPDEHRELFGKLPWVFASSLDAQHRSWASVLVGYPGFMHSPHERLLSIHARAAFGDPLGANLAVGTPLGLLGIELETRRRNRMNGTVVALRDGRFDVRVDQSFGNCPQYIQAREPFFTAEPESVSTPRALRAEGRELSERALSLIAHADTFFIATAAAGARGDDAVAGCDVSHRGGNPGFVRADSEAGRSVLLAPDFRGNFFFNSLGNLAHNPSAGLLFVDFDSGDVLTLTGSARVLWDGPLVAAFAGAQRMVRFEPDSGWWLAGAAPMRWSPPQFARQLADDPALIRERSRQKSRLLPAETQRTSAKAPQATFARLKSQASPPARLVREVSLDAAPASHASPRASLRASWRVSSSSLSYGRGPCPCVLLRLTGQPPVCERNDTRVNRAMRTSAGGCES